MGNQHSVHTLQPFQTFIHKYKDTCIEKLMYIDMKTECNNIDTKNNIRILDAINQMEHIIQSYPQHTHIQVQLLKESIKNLILIQKHTNTMSTIDFHTIEQVITQIDIFKSGPLTF